MIIVIHFDFDDLMRMLQAQLMVLISCVQTSVFNVCHFIIIDVTMLNQNVYSINYNL
jgi:hypothetical protein